MAKQEKKDFLVIGIKIQVILKKALHVSRSDFAT